jgi:hypothetical protein
MLGIHPPLNEKLGFLVIRLGFWDDSRPLWSSLTENDKS